MASALGPMLTVGAGETSFPVYTTWAGMPEMDASARSAGTMTKLAPSNETR